MDCGRCASWGAVIRRATIMSQAQASQQRGQIRTADLLAQKAVVHFDAGAAMFPPTAEGTIAQN